jgi:hypothetical protein
MIPQTFPTRKLRRTSKPTPRKKVRTRERPRVYFVGSLSDAVASRDGDRERNAPSAHPARNAPSADACIFSEHLYGDHRGFAGNAIDRRTLRCRARRFRGDVANASSTRLPKRESARGGTRRARRGESGRRFDSPPTRPIFFGRVRTRISDAFVEFGRDRTCFERARRVARARSATTPGAKFFFFPERRFFSCRFFFRGSSTPGPGETWIAVGTRGRAVTPARESAADA